LTRETVAELLAAVCNEMMKSYARLSQIPQLQARHAGGNLRRLWCPKARSPRKPTRTRARLVDEDKGRWWPAAGPPRELKRFFLEQVLPRLRRHVSGVRMFHRELR